MNGKQINKVITPSFESIHQWESYSSQLMVEYRQSIEEGKDIEKFKGLFESVSHLTPGKQKEQFSDILFDMVLNAPQRIDYAYNEPSDLIRIRELCPKSNLSFDKVPDGVVLKDKIKGAWTGRICGCLLGKPIEGICTNELIPILQETGNYPMHRYIYQKELPEELCQKYRFNLRDRCYPDNIEIAPKDDDTNYTVLAGCLISKYGREFAPADIVKIWLNEQSKDAYCTAERVAYRNFVNGFLPPDCAEYKNPYREWIGAQIRADYFGYINPGNHEAAAEMAWKDASISHVKNGIYGEMFVAAMIATAAVTGDIQIIILSGLSQIPYTSRLNEKIMQILNEYKNGISKENCFEKIHKDYDENDSHDWCHTISNTAIVAASLLYGEGNYGKTICLAVQAGFDTDCNGATAGSIIGMMNGMGGIREEWYKPIHNMLDTSIFSIGKVNIDDLVEMTIKHIAI